MKVQWGRLSTGQVVPVITLEPSEYKVESVEDPSIKKAVDSTVEEEEVVPSEKTV